MCYVVIQSLSKIIKADSVSGRISTRGDSAILKQVVW